VGLRAFFANVLADLKFLQTIDDERTNNQSGEKRGEAGERSAERQITEDTKRRKIMEELYVQQPIKQLASLGFEYSRWSSVVRRSL
jgi:hypothetical protein